MEESRMDRLEYILCFSVMGLVPLHLYLDLTNLANGIDKGYGHSFPPRSYVLIGAYLLIVFAADVFMLRHRKLEPAGALRVYWGSACAAIVVVLVLQAAALTSDAVTMIGLLYAPCVVLRPLWELLGVTATGTFDHVSIAATGIVCLFNWTICRFAGKEEREGTP